MTASDLITIYLDGEATDAERSHLFEALATSPELQREFTAALAINTAAGRDARGMVPPDHVTASIFAKAFAPSVEAVVHGATSTWSFTPLLLVLGGVLAGTVFSLFTTQDVPLGESITVRRERELVPQPRVESLDENQSLPADGGDGIQRPNLYGQRDGFNARGYLPTSALSYPQSVEHPVAPLQQSADAMANGTTATVQATRLHMVEQLRVIHVGTPGMATELTLDQRSEAQRWSVSVRGMSTLQLFPGRSTATERDMAFNNMGIGVRFALTDHFAVGAEVGQETFPVFVRTSSGEFAPRATMIWAAAVGRYTGPSLPVFETVRPFVQAAMGASPQGPVGRGTIGMSMMLTNGLSMQAGIEGTALAYQFDGAWSTTEKLGFTYGLTFQW